MATYHKNNDGLVQRYGPYRGRDARPVEETGVNDLKTLVVDVRYDSLPAPVDGDMGIAHLPAGSILEKATLYVDKAFASAAPTTDTVEVGFSQLDGTVIDADGAIPATTVDTLTAGAVVDGAGALVGAQVDAALEAFLEMTASAALTAGTAQLVVRYRLPAKVAA